MGLAPIGARVAEHDHGGAWIEFVCDLAQKLEPDSTVVGIAGDVGDAAFGGDPLGDGAEVALVFEDLGDLGDPLNEDEAAKFSERECVERMKDGEKEDAAPRSTEVTTSHRT